MTVVPASPPSDRVVFLLGAGASADAGVPVMEQMYERFIARLSRDNRKFVAILMDRVKPWAEQRHRRAGDVEILLASLERYAALHDDLGMALSGAVVPTDLHRGAGLASRLRSKIRGWCLQVRSEDVGYLQALVRLANIYQTLDIFTLNYDMCVELAARDAGIRCETGFGLEWDPNRFDEPTDDGPWVRLYKLHGCVSWYQTEDYHYLHIPVQSTAELKGIDGRPLRELIVYPELEKEPELSPYPELLSRFRQALQRSKVFVVVGYSFADRRLSDIITEALNINRALQVVVVDRAPNEEVLGQWEAARVLRLAGRFKDILEADQVQSIVQALVSAQGHHEQALRELPRSQLQARVYFTSAVGDFITARHTEAAQQLVKEATAVVSTPPTQEQSAFVFKLRDWAEFAPGLSHSAGKAWWEVGRHHLSALELAVIDTVGSSNGQLAQRAREYRQAHPGYEMWMPRLSGSEIQGVADAIGLTSRATRDQQPGVAAITERLRSLAWLQTTATSNDMVARDKIPDALEAYYGSPDFDRLVSRLVALL